MIKRNNYEDDTISSNHIISKTIANLFPNMNNEKFQLSCRQANAIRSMSKSVKNNPPKKKIENQMMLNAFREKNEIEKKKNKDK